jgi:RNA polymerase sigma factor (sigma-70 family)
MPARLEPAEITHVYRTYVAMVRRRAERVVGNAAVAEDLAQQAFIRYLEHRRAGGSENDTAAFLYRTATNLALNHLRDRQRRSELERANLSAGAAVVHDGVEDRLALRRVLAAVSEEEATIAAYYYLDGLEHEEIATLLGVRRRTVGRRLVSFHEQAQRLLRGAPSEVVNVDVG